MPEEPYNPLARINIARSVELALLQQPLVPIPIDERFEGAGVYSIFYQGDFPAYQPISSDECKVPIYVGQARPKGARTGLVELDTPAGSVLFNRLKDHWKSIDTANNLRIEDFRCRYLVLDEIFISMGEALLIHQFKPLWNVVVSGFGLHDPGGGRHGSERSEWDELHPGRPWYEKMKRVTTPEAVEQKIRKAFATGFTATNEALPEGVTASEAEVIKPNEDLSET